MTGNHDCHCTHGPTIDRVPPRLEGELNQTVMYVGVAYIPKVVDGYLTWSNDYDLPNPNPVYIQGKDGAGIKSATIDKNNHFILTLTDDSTLDLGVLNFPQIVNETSKDSFPAVGSSQNIYISNEGLFRWDEATKAYVLITSSNGTTQTQADWNETNPESVSYIKNKPTSLADKHFTYTQNTASATWVIEHNLNTFPSVTVVDSAGSVVIGEVKYNNANQVTIVFNAAFSGKAYLN